MMKKRRSEEPKKTHLKLKDVVERGKLHATTASYILSRPELFPGMPPAGSRGMQREFSLRQATRLTIGTHLVRAGFSIEDSYLIVHYAEETVQRNQRRLQDPDGNDVLFSKEKGAFPEPWKLTVADEDHVSVYRQGANPDILLPDEYFNFRTQTDDDEYRSDDAIRLLLLNLSQIEIALKKNLQIST